MRHKALVGRTAAAWMVRHRVVRHRVTAGRVALGVGVVVLGTACGGGRGGKGPSHVTSVPTSAAPATTGPATLTTLRSLGGPLPTGPAQATTAAPPIGGTPPTPAATIAAPPVSSSATPFAATPTCAPAALTAAPTTDHPSYPTAAPITITVTVSNRSSSTCQFQAVAGPGGVAMVEDAGGTVVWEPRRVTTGPTPSPFSLLRAGSGFVAGTVVWDQHGCPPPCTGAAGPSLGRGRYRVVATVPGAAAAVAEVTIS